MPILGRLIQQQIKIWCQKYGQMEIQLSDWVENIVEKEKLLVTSNFSFFHNVFKSCLLLMHQNGYLWSKEFRKKPFEDIVVQEEKAVYQLFLFFPQCFLLCQPHIVWATFILSSANAFELDQCNTSLCQKALNHLETEKAILKSVQNLPILHLLPRNIRLIRLGKSLNNVFLFLINLYLTGFVFRSWRHQVK